MSRAAIDDLARRFTEIRRATTALIEPLSAEDCAVQSMDDASPAKWHLAHTSWYFETFVLETSPGYRPFHPAYRELFNSYYQTVGPQHPRPRRGLLTRPSLDEVLRYREHVDQASLDWLFTRQDRSECEVFELGLHHEQQHQELLLMDIKHAFASNPLRPAYRELAQPTAGAPTSPLEWWAAGDAVHEIGHAGGGFGFDNEFPRHRVYLAPFELASRLATCLDYLAFMEDGGYQRPELWLSDGWVHAQRAGWQAPLYWERDGHGWQHYTLGGVRPLELDAPLVHVSYYEADAFARWCGARLPTEAEWEVWASGQPIAGNFLESGHLEPVADCGGSPAKGPIQLFGDLWEWTQSAYSPYPGYRPAQGALGEYNGKFMCSQFTLRGGSCVTPRDHVRATYRNFFYPQQRWAYAGVRLARDVG